MSNGLVCFAVCEPPLRLPLGYQTLCLNAACEASNASCGTRNHRGSCAAACHPDKRRPPWKEGMWQLRSSRTASRAAASYAGASWHSVGSSPDVDTGASALMVNAALRQGEVAAWWDWVGVG